MPRETEHTSGKEKQAVQQTDQQRETHQGHTDSSASADFMKIHSQQTAENIASGESVSSSSRQEGLSDSMFQHALRRGLLEEGSTETTMPSSSRPFESGEPAESPVAYAQRLELLRQQADARLRALQGNLDSAAYQLEAARRRIESYSGKHLRPEDNAQFNLSPKQKRAKVDFENTVADFKARPQQGERSGLSNELRPEDISSSSSSEEGV